MLNTSEELDEELNLAPKGRKGTDSLLIDFHEAGESTDRATYKSVLQDHHK